MMKSARWLVLGLYSVMAWAGATNLAIAADTLRPEVGKPLQAAQQLMKDQKFKDALGKINDADAVPNKTPYEKLTVERMRGAAASGAGEADVAADAFDAVIASGKLGQAETLQITQGVANLLYRSKEYAKAITWGERYEKAGGTSGDIETLMAQSYYLNGDFGNAARLVQSQVSAGQKAGQTPSETQLQLLMSCYLKQNDQAGYLHSLELLVTYYPKKEYWQDLLTQVQRQPGFSDRLTLDVYRLKVATGTLTSAADYMEMAQLALQAGFPVEAQQVITQGYAAKVLGVGQEAQRQQRLKDLADKQAADDRKLAGGDVNAATQRGSNAMIATGYNLTLNGRQDQGIALMQKAIAAGGLKNPEDAKLHLGEAYLKSGKTAEANKVLKTVQGKDGADTLARLWIICGHSA